MVTRCLLLLASGLLSILAGSAFGQGSPLDFQRVAPRPLPLGAQAAPLPPADDRATADNKTPAFDRVDGIVLLDRAEEVRRSGWSKQQGVTSKGSGLLASPQLATRLAPFLGKPATFGDLQEICAEIVRFYRDQNRPVVDAQLPEQDVTNGVLQILVIEGRTGRVIAEGQRWFPEERLARGIRSRPGDGIDSHRLLDDLNWLNRNPFRHSDMAFRKGAAPGETDLILKTTDRFPLRPYVTYDNWGSDLTGNERWQAGLNWGNAFRLDQVISYQFSTAPDPEVFSAHAGTWTIPLPWRHVLDLYGSYARSQPQDADIDFDAKSLQTGIQYTIPLQNIRGIKHEVAFGADFKQSNNNLLFGGTSIFSAETDILQYRANYQFRQIDPAGTTSGQASLVYSPGEATDRNTDVAFDQQRAFAEAEYLYGRITLQRKQKLPRDLTLVGTASGQLASGNLLSSEQFSLGGATTIRGYEEVIANGDRGWLASLELYSPPFAILSRIRDGAPDDELKLLLFFDAGGVSNVDLLPGEESYIGLASVGAGLRYRLNTWASVRFDYGWSLRDIPDVETDDSRAYISVTLSY